MFFFDFLSSIPFLFENASDTSEFDGYLEMSTDSRSLTNYPLPKASGFQSRNSCKSTDFAVLFK